MITTYNHQFLTYMRGRQVALSGLRAQTGFSPCPDQESNPDLLYHWVKKLKTDGLVPFLILTTRPDLSKFTDLKSSLFRWETEVLEKVSLPDNYGQIHIWYIYNMSVWSLSFVSVSFIFWLWWPTSSL